MEYTKEAGGKSTVKLDIRFSEEEWQEAIMAAYKKVRAKYTVPGFRKGKAPKPVLENYYGKGVFFEDAIDILYSKHYYDILEQEKENFLAIDEPDLSVGDMKEGEGIELIAVVPVRPEIEMDAYTGLSIRKYDYKVTDADVAGSIAKTLSSRAGKAEVTDRPAKYDDTVNIDFKGFVGMYQFPGGTAEGYDLVLGSGSFIPGFEDQVVGMSIGETKDVMVKFPDDYQGGEDLAGKDARFEVKVNAITEKVLPDLTDDFVKANLGADTVEEYKVKLRARLEKQAEDQSRNDTENSIIDELVKHVQGDIPDVMVEREMDSQMERYDQNLQAYQGFSLDDYLSYMKQDKKQFRENFRERSLAQVKATLAMQYIIKKEEIKATDEDLEAEIAKRAAEVDKKPEEMAFTDKQKANMRDEIVIDKFLQFITDNNDLYVLDDSAAAPAAEKPAEE
ncbi:MAG: trigger factor [Clostridia bacterium]|nr:trigger factor [Clostridia bacterium]